MRSGSATLRLLLNSSKLYAYMDDKAGIEQYMYSLGQCSYMMTVFTLDGWIFDLCVSKYGIVCMWFCNM